MKVDKHSDLLESSRGKIASTVRELRKFRGWTQAELSGRLDLSQSRLSELERGSGSFSAEQLLALIKLFNVPLSRFSTDTDIDEHAVLQNALARLGARHLHERDDVLPSERLTEANDVIRQAIVAAIPRLLTAVPPVLISNAGHVNLRSIDARLSEAGFDRRLSWLIENTVEAVTSELKGPLPRAWGQLYRRGLLVMQAFQQSLATHSKETSALDILDPQIRSQKTLDEVRASSSPISRRWGIVTGLQPTDFAAALRDARVDH